MNGGALLVSWPCAIRRIDVISFIHFSYGGTGGGKGRLVGPVASFLADCGARQLVGSGEGSRHDAADGFSPVEGVGGCLRRHAADPLHPIAASDRCRKARVWTFPGGHAV